MPRVLVMPKLSSPSWTLQKPRWRDFTRVGRSLIRSGNKGHWKHAGLQLTSGIPFCHMEAERSAAQEDAPSAESTRASLTRFAWLSIGAAVLTIGLKTVAYLLTGSVGLLSDALESVVNLVSGVMALAMLSVAARPGDEDHAYGHTKAEYFSSGVEGALILLAAASIAFAAVQRLITPRPLEQVGLGIALSTLASLVNLGVALLLLRVGRKRNSITLEAN